MPEQENVSQETKEVKDASPSEEKKEAKEVKEPKSTPKSEPKKERVLPVCNEHEKLFEAPDGTILVGAKDRDSIPYRKMGININPMRGIK